MFIIVIYHCTRTHARAHAHALSTSNQTVLRSLHTLLSGLLACTPVLLSELRLGTSQVDGMSQRDAGSSHEPGQLMPEAARSDSEGSPYEALPPVGATGRSDDSECLTRATYGSASGTPAREGQAYVLLSESQRPEGALCVAPPVLMLRRRWL